MLTADKLTVAYGNNTVLENLSAAFQPGMIHGLVGLNGAGKTTFLNTLFGIKHAISGQVTYEGQPLKRADIGFLETENFFYSYITGSEYLSLFEKNGKSFDVERYNNIFKLPLNQLVDDYSTGMKKKLALMAILRQDKPVILLDEPFNSLDLETSRILYLLLLRLKERGKTLIITSHIIESLTKICDDIFVLNNRKIGRIYHKEEFASIENDGSDINKCCYSKNRLPLRNNTRSHG